MFPKDTDNPFTVFETWLEEAKAHHAIAEPTSMCLATATVAGIPSARMVLLKEANTQGFVFYTNVESRKGNELLSNPYASLCFFWQPLGKQIRVEGSVLQVSEKEADMYYQSRHRDSRLGAHASQQSRELAGGTKQLIADVAKIAAKYPIGEIPRPDYWRGFRVQPTRIEFWQEGNFRLHQRRIFTRTNIHDNLWHSTMLYP